MEDIDILLDRFIEFYGSFLLAESTNIKKIAVKEDGDKTYIHIPKPKRSKSDMRVYVEQEADKFRLSVFTEKTIPKELPEYYKVEVTEKTKTTKKTRVSRLCSHKAFPGELDRIISTWTWIEYANR